MKNKKVVVLLKYFKGELNPFDGAALECALSLGIQDITVLTMAPQSAKAPLLTLTRLGVKAVIVSDKIYAGSDTIATSYILAEAIKKLAPDLVFCGRQSVDGDTAQVPVMFAQRLGFDVKTKVMEVSEDKFLLRSGEEVAPKDGTIFTFERCKTLRFPSIFSKVGVVTEWSNAELNLDPQKCGFIGSPTRVVKSYESSVGRRSCSYKNLGDLGELIREGLTKKSTEKELYDGEKLDNVLFIGNVGNTAKSIAKSAEELIVSDNSPQEIAEIIKQKSPQAVLWEDCDFNKEFAPKVAVILGAGMCADCISFRVEEGKLVMTRPALGGNVTADIICTHAPAFCTVKTTKKGESDVVFSVGKGAVDYLDKIKELAQKYDAELCCSRIVADSGKMPYSAQIGLTGRTVSPKVYVGFGLSGAVQHTCAISNSGTVIAINCDKNARIFDYADYGIVDDIKNLR